MKHAVAHHAAAVVREHAGQEDAISEQISLSRPDSSRGSM